MHKITVPLQRDETKALFDLAAREKRDPRYQAALLIRQALERAGLVASTQKQGVADAQPKK